MQLEPNRPASNKGRAFRGMNDQIGLGDVVSFGWNDGYYIGTVIQTHTNGTVDVYRPYIHTNDFSCSGRREGSQSVICYIGTETVNDVDPSRLTLIAKGDKIR